MGAWLMLVLEVVHEFYDLGDGRMQYLVMLELTNGSYWLAAVVQGRRLQWTFSLPHGGVDFKTLLSPFV
jgi:hypothetical protein